MARRLTLIFRGKVVQNRNTFTLTEKRQSVSAFIITTQAKILGRAMTKHLGKQKIPFTKRSPREDTKSNNDISFIVLC